MNQGLSFPIDLIETHTYLYYALSLYCIFPQTLSAYCVPGLVRGWEDALIRPVLALEELPVQWGGQTREQIICNVLKFKSFF